MTFEEMQIKLGELAMYARQKGWDDDYTEAVNKVDECIKGLQTYKEAWNKMQDELNNRMQEPDDMHIGEDYYSGLCSASVMIDKYRPKEGEAE